MASRRGRPRVLTRQQIRIVLKWHQRRLRFRALVGSVRVFSRRQGIPVYVLRQALARGVLVPVAAKKANYGHVELAHIVSAWVREYRRFAESDISNAQMASRLGVSRNTIHDCVKRKGRYIRSTRSEKVQLAPFVRTWLSRRATDLQIAQRASALQLWKGRPGRS